MSAFTTKGRSTPLVSIPGVSAGIESMDEEAALQSPHANGVSDQLHNFIASTRQIEAALHQEKIRSKKLHKELTDAHHHYERIIKEAQARNQEHVIQETKLKGALHEFQEREKRLMSDLQGMSLEFKKIRAELNHYKAAWASVLQREREAKTIINESAAVHKKLNELDTKSRQLEEALHREKTERDQIERHAKSYQLELQNALVRLHSSETKFSEISKELQALSQSKRNMDEEISKIERSMKERYQWETAKDRENTKAECARQIAQEREKLREDLSQERERYRDQIRKNLEAEYEKKLAYERDRYSKVREEAETEICALRDSLNRANQQATESRNEAQTLRADYDSKLQTAAKDAAQLEARIQELLFHMGEMKSTSQQMRQEMERVEELRKELDQVRTREKDLESVIDQLDRDLKEKELFGKTALEQQIAAKQTEIEAQLADERALHEKRLKDQQAEFEKRIRELTSGAEQKQKEAQAELERQLWEQKSTYEKRLKELAHTEDENRRRLLAEFQQRSIEQRQDFEIRLANEKKAAQTAMLEAERKLEDVTITERNRAAQFIGRSRHRFRKKAQAAGRVARDTVARDYFEAALAAEVERSNSLEAALISEKERFDQMMELLELELERMRSFYPLNELLNSKNAEIQALEEKLNANAEPAAEARQTLDVLVKQRDRLETMVREAEQRIESQRERIRRASEMNTLLAGPAMDIDIIVPEGRGPLLDC